MKRLQPSFFVALLIVCFLGCKPGKVDQYDALVQSTQPYHKALYGLTEVIVHDFFPPPIAARIYAYANVAGYEAMAAGNPAYKSMAGQLNELAALPKPSNKDVICFPFAATWAMLKVGKALTFSEDSMTLRQNAAKAYYTELGMDEASINASIAFGDTIASSIIAWSKKDKYLQTRSFPKFPVQTTDPARWRPTQPDYLDALEPHWGLIRPMVLDSTAQIRATPPQPFSKEKGSVFYNEAKEVWQTVVDSTPSRIALAKFFDDSPMSSIHEGHVTFTIKKITPGGHWLNIVKQVTTQRNMDFNTTIETYMLTSIAMFDAFLACWEEKYRSNLVRPVTYINENIDPEWSPILQTPPFPEHTSGHSVVSAAAATILNDRIGPQIAFADSTEIVFGMPIREFNSFYACADSAALSRMYGGIHYRTGMTAGLEQGKKVGTFVLAHLKTKN